MGKGGGYPADGRNADPPSYCWVSCPWGGGVRARVSFFSGSLVFCGLSREEEEMGLMVRSPGSQKQDGVG